MFSKLVSAVALALVATVAHPTYAASEPDFAAIEAGLPDSVDYAHRMRGNAVPSNEQIESLESGNPDSVRYGDRVRPSAGETSHARSMTPDFPKFEDF